MNKIYHKAFLKQNVKFLLPKSTLFLSYEIFGCVRLFENHLMLYFLDILLLFYVKRGQRIKINIIIQKQTGITLSLCIEIIVM